ncbi:5-hydroxytryptamine receptor 1-like [Anopheles stephensi]|uniref:5-hydroxytryptamine receptor 1-like n=1 Tax=Anopheles stephensi TaxID=30069 RepID=UPI0007D38047|nr:5-hydroxytryptamine receptor 1-like [Anopheles stephensi]XP_035899280.1 5-hydroxytryptamine receptor 1-like [Anopheles stephensi]XP_035899281.1 5-hydroxytryptamine receptor 1-like [Anopheles stephensi]XP_035899282.1 5-hydroxytryptamine receptor 1-like [Anopheles stephensi]
MDSATIAPGSKHRTDIDGAGRTDGVPVALTVATTVANLLLASPSPGLAAATTITTSTASWAITTETAAQPYHVYGANLSSLPYLDANSTASLFSLSPVDASTPAPTGTPNNVTVSTIVISIILLAVIIGTVIGNVLVCVAVCLVRKLRRPCNYLLVSLAISDLCVALLVMPMALLYEVLEEWRFGEVFCDIWVAFDVLSCTASILNLCAISVDRYWAITKPLEYGVKRTPRRMIACIVLVWLAAACISLPPLLILGNEHEINGQPACSVCQNFFYQIYATLGSFYIPLAVMLFVYFQIFRAARRIVMEEKRAQKRLESAINGATQVVQQQEKKPPGMTTGVGEKGAKVTTSSPQNKRLRFQLAKERKASTTLGIIMSAFTICWLPFFILALVRPFMKDDHRTLSSFFLWLGYANSLLNPIIYATLNRDFRKPFQEILYFRCSSLNNMMREDFYHSQYGDPGSQRLVITNDGGARESFL